MPVEYIDQNGQSFDSMEDLIINAMDNAMSNYDDANSKKEEEADLCKWLIDGKDYIPTTNLKTVEKLPSGVYKVVETRDDYKMSPITLNTDELFTFSKDFTSKILDEVKIFWDRKQIYEDNKIQHKRGILLCGTPGCGKTSIINLLVEKLIKDDGIVFMVSSAKDFNILYSILNPVIRKIEASRPIITIIEDVDQIISSMGGNDSMLLDFMDGKASINDHLVILTSNDTSDLSDALLRPSRIDLTYEIANPDIDIRKEYFMKKGLSEEDATTYAQVSEGFSFAELKELYIGTIVSGKSLESVVLQLQTPYECKDYLVKPTLEIKGID